MTLGLIALSFPLGSVAVSAADSPSTAVITFNDAARQVQLTIPTPACPPSQPNCEWKFFLNEPKLSVDVATIYGTSGTLTLDYPPDFCGVIQADAYVGPPWVATRGFQHTIEDCTPPTATTGGPPGVTQQPSPPGTTPTTPPPSPQQLGSVAAASVPTTAPPADVPQVSAAATVPATATGSAPAQLPFTGASIKPFLFSGLTLIALGLFLLTSSVTRRRMVRRIGDCPWPTAVRPKRPS